MSVDQEDFSHVIEVSLNAQEILRTPLLNKGTGFTYLERSELGLHGLLPSHVSTIQQQAYRRYINFKNKKLEIDKYLFLTALQDRNEVLFYYLALEHCDEMLPYIYTPTVGDVSLDYSNLYSQNRGFYVSYPLKEKMSEMIANIPRKDIDVIVVTDGSRILGLGDVGIGGMTIPVGKLSLYTLFGGIHPEKTLPVIFDVGTDNPSLLENPLYLGWRHPRITGHDYDQFVELFIKQIKQRFPNVLLQWEDFAKPHAHDLLTKYKDIICSFNDDIQGTASVALAAILAALKKKNQALIDQKIVIVGGGGAGIGIANILVQYMVYQGASESLARSVIYIIDRFGLIHENLDKIDPHQKIYAKSFEEIQRWNVKALKNIDLEDAIINIKPSILIGVSAKEGIFTEKIVKQMNLFCQRPIIFPLSNPTSKAEAQPHQLIQWTKGQAIVATGSPPTVIDYKKQKVNIAQCNNVYIFPGVGLGIIATKSKKVIDEMFLKAAETLAEHAPILKDPEASLFPRLKELREVSKKIAIEVAKIAIKRNLAQVPSDDVEKLVSQTIWTPLYPKIKKLR